MLRVAIVALAWVLRLVLGFRAAGPAVLVLVDLLVGVTHIWATLPLRRALGNHYGLAPSWTKVIELPLAAAVILAVADLLRAID